MPDWTCAREGFGYVRYVGTTCGVTLTGFRTLTAPTETVLALMNVRNRVKVAVWVVVALFFGVVLADALGVFSAEPYTAVPHGNHVHYVPDDRDPNVPVNEFPMREPEAGQTISPQGEIVSVNGE